MRNGVSWLNVQISLSHEVFFAPCSSLWISRRFSGFNIMIVNFKKYCEQNDIF